MRNYLALFHILIIPLVIYFILQETSVHVFWGIFLLFLSVLVSFIEWIYFKKIRHQESFLRPFADKLIVLIVLLFLTVLNKFSWFILGLFVLRDIIIGIIRIRASRDDILIKGRWYGKIITICQLVIVFSVLIVEFLTFDGLEIWIPMLKMVQFVFIGLAILLSLVSITHYSSVYGKKVRLKRKQGRLIEKEKLIILVNKKSGGYKNPYRRRLLKIFAKRRGAKIIPLKNEGEMYENVKDVVKNYKHVIIAGGDGSFESALNNPTLKKKSLGFFPMGAGNSYYSYFYKGKKFEYLRSRFLFREIPLSIMEVEYNQKKLQTTFLGIGIDAEVIKETKEIKNHNFTNYLVACIKVIFGPRKSYDINCEVDGRKYHWKNCFNLIIAKVPFIGYGLKSVLGESLSDSEEILGMANVNTHSAIFNKGLRIWTLILTQLGLDKAPLVPLKGKKFEISSSKEFALQAGGEFLGYSKKIKVKVVRKQKVLVI
jgi:diacylglycerol kinase family enzyme